MDFEKIYADFTAAKAANDFDAMSDMIARVIECCNALLRAGRENEVTAHAIQIAEHINVLLYRIMKLLSDATSAGQKLTCLRSPKTTSTVSTDSFRCFISSAKVFTRRAIILGR